MSLKEQLINASKIKRKQVLAIATIKELVRRKSPKHVRGIKDLSGFMGKRYSNYGKNLYQHTRHHSWYVPYTWNEKRVYIYDGAQRYIEKFIKEHNLYNKKLDEVLILMALAEE